MDTNIVNNYGTPVFVTVAVAFGGALIGGVLAFLGGRRSDQRTRYSQKQNAVQVLLHKYRTESIRVRGALVSARVLNTNGELMTLRAPDGSYTSMVASGLEAIMNLDATLSQTTLSQFSTACLKAFMEIVEEPDAAEKTFQVRRSKLTSADAVLLVATDIYLRADPHRANRILRVPPPKLFRIHWRRLPHEL